MNLSPNKIIELLDLIPHPTCGYVRQSYLSKNKLPENVLPEQFSGDRFMGSVLYFLVTPETPIKLHKIHSEQMYHFYLGDPLEVLLLNTDGSAEVKTMGHDLLSGMLSQLYIPGDTFHVSRIPKGSFALLATTEWPSVEPSDVSVPSVEQLILEYPTARELILQFACV